MLVLKFRKEIKKIVHVLCRNLRKIEYAECLKIFNVYFFVSVAIFQYLVTYLRIVDMQKNYIVEVLDVVLIEL